MLYATTKDPNNVHTPRHPLTADRAGDGGLFVPFRLPTFRREEIISLKECSFGQCVARILNLFCGSRLTGWDVDFVLGRHPVRLTPMSHRILMAECWNNPGHSFEWAVRELRALVLPEQPRDTPVSDWMRISVRIGYVFGIYGQLSAMGLVGFEKPLDISVAAEDFSGPMALWYAKRLGLPLGITVFGCGANSGAWDLLHHGELQNGAAVGTAPQSLERLIFHRLGREHIQRYFHALEKRRSYTLSPDALSVINEGFWGAVISPRRTESVIRNVGLSSDPAAALAYGALQDYRAANNEAGPALILSENKGEG